MTVTDTQAQRRKASRFELIAFGLAAIGALAGFVSRDFALLVFVAAFCVKTIEARIYRDLSS